MESLTSAGKDFIIRYKKLHIFITESVVYWLNFHDTKCCILLKMTALCDAITEIFDEGNILII